MSDAKYKTKCPHCGKVMRVDERMINLFTKCPSCDSEFKVEHVRKIKKKKTQSFQSQLEHPLVVLAAKLSIGLTLLIVIVLGGLWSLKNVGSIVYGRETAEHRSWYAQFEKGMSPAEVVEILAKMPNEGEFAVKALVEPQMRNASRADWLCIPYSVATASADASSGTVEYSNMHDGFGGSVEFKGYIIDGKVYGTTTRRQKLKDEVITTRISISGLSNDSFRNKHAGTVELTAKSQGRNIELDQKLYLQQLGGGFEAAEWIYRFRVKPDDKIGTQQIRFHFHKPSSGPSIALERISKVGF